MKMESVPCLAAQRGLSIDITIKDPGQNRMVVLATIKNPKRSCFEQSVDIYIHHPPVSIYDTTTSGESGVIQVEGNITRKKYYFMVEDFETKPCKIAQVNNHSIEIGPNIDIAFICFAAYAIEKIFSVNMYWDDPNAPVMVS